MRQDCRRRHMIDGNLGYHDEDQSAGIGLRERNRGAMKIKLTPDKDIRVEKIRIGRVPTLILRPAIRSSIPVSILWIHGGGYITGMKEMVYMSRAMDLVKKYGVTVYSPH